MVEKWSREVTYDVLELRGVWSDVSFRERDNVTVMSVQVSEGYCSETLTLSDDEISFLAGWLMGLVIRHRNAS